MQDGLLLALDAVLMLPIAARTVSTLAADFQLERFRHRAIRRTIDGQCPVCGYDVHVTPAACPECGTNIASFRCPNCVGPCAPREAA